MTDPKREKPESDHPHEDDLSFDLPQGEEGAAGHHVPMVGEAHPLEDLSLSASTEEFHFSGPAEDLDFTEPADFAFPTSQPGEGEVATEHSGEFAAAEFAAAEPAAAEGFFGAEEMPPAESPPPEEAVAEPLVAGEGIADLEAAEEEKPKPKFELPAWARIAEWVTVGLLAAGALVAVICSIVWVKDPKQVTLTLNIGCPLLVALIPYALWRSSARWVTPSASAVYTVMLALSTAALIVGVWFLGLEISRHDWQFSKARVGTAKPPRVAMPIENKAEPAPEPAAAKGTAEPAK